MSKPWVPQNWEEACKRNAGRRKLHMRKRKARADRIVRVLHAMGSANATELRETAFGWVTITAQAMNLSKATASRDFALVRRIHRQFERACLAAASILRRIRSSGHGTSITTHSRRLRVKQRGIRNLWATSLSTLANKKPKNPIAGSISCLGRTQTTSHS